MSITFRDVLAARELGPAACNGAALGFALQQLAEAGVVSWTMVSVGTPDEGDERDPFAGVRRISQAAGLGLIRLVARWTAADRSRDTVASVALISGMDLDGATRLRDTCGQQVALFAGDESAGAVALLLRTGGVQVVGPPDAEHITAAFAGASGRSLTFTGFEYPAQSFIQGLITLGHRAAAAAQEA